MPSITPAEAGVAKEPGHRLSLAFPVVTDSISGCQTAKDFQPPVYAPAFTFLEVTLTGRYPALYPAEPGLSSGAFAPALAGANALAKHLRKNTQHLVVNQYPAL
jgi:hypothetical protein